MSTKSLFRVLVSAVLLAVNLAFSQIPTSGLVAYYPFSGNANDESGKGNNGTVKNGATLTSDRFGISNRAYKFDGVNDYVDCGNGSSLSFSTALTMSFWILFDTDPYSFANNPIIVDKAYSWRFSYEAVAIDPHYLYIHQIYSGLWDWDILNTNASRWQANKWYHIAATYDGSYHRIYVDGTQQNSISLSKSLSTSSYPLFIGAQSDGPDSYFKGGIDDVAIYSRALTLSEIQQLYNYSDGLQSDKLLITKGSVGSSDTDMYTIDSNAANEKLVFNDVGDIRQARWSADNSKITFNSNASSTGKYEVFTLNGDGSNIKQITATSPTYGNGFSLFRSDSKIWYANAQTAGVTEIYEINLDGSGSKKLTNFQNDWTQIGAYDVDAKNGKVYYNKQDASWAPSGRIYSANLDFTNERRLTSAEDYESFPRVSPDGKKLVYHSNDVDDAANLFVINVDGTGKTKLTNVTGSQQCVMPVWSSDGLLIYYSFNNSSQSDIYKIGINGQNGQKLTNTANVNEYVWECKGTAVTTNYTLSLTKAGTGDGQVKVNGTLKTLPYSAVFAAGENVALEAMAASGSTFNGWSGDATGNTISTTVAMSGNKSVMLNFQAIPPAPPISFEGPEKAAAGAEFTLDVQVGSAAKPVTNLKIVSLEMLYANTNYIDYLSYEVGSFLTGATAQVIPEDASGKVSASVFKTSGGNSGYGVILRLKFRVTSSAPEGKQFLFTFGQIQANDANGAAITLSPLSKTVTVENGVVVWPGDANNDGRVNIFDINPIVALYWNKTGPQRPNASTNWIGQMCPKWDPEAATYADCNGDGIVNIFDINAVIINFNKTHTLSKAGETEQLVKGNVLSGPPLILTADKTQVAPGEEFWISTVVGSSQNPVSRMKILSLEMTYDKTNYVDYLAYELGNFMNGASGQVIPEDAAGKVSSSVFKTSGSNSGTGQVIRLKFKMAANAPSNQQIRFDVGQFMANDEDGNLINLTPYGLTINAPAAVEQKEQAPQSFALQQNYPNPFNPSTQINYELPVRSQVKLEIYNVIGQRIEESSAVEDAGVHQYVWRPTGDSGIYFCRLEATPLQGEGKPYRSIIKMTFTK